MLLIAEQPLKLSLDNIITFFKPLDISKRVYIGMMTPIRKLIMDKLQKTQKYFFGHN